MSKIMENATYRDVEESIKRFTDPMYTPLREFIPEAL